MTDDEKFNQWLESAARDYNRPPDDTPRDAMWAAIDAATAQPSGTGSIRPLSVRRSRFTVHLWQAAAALLLLAGGIGIGRVWHGASPNDRSIAAGVPVGRTPDLAVADTAFAGTPSAARVAGMADRNARSATSESYDIAAVQHLSRAEALLTSFRAGGDGETRGSMERWARDLLADTRLLLDSPAATDARRRHLLEDLELVLAQIVQLPAEASADRALIQRSIERGAVLSRLRSTIPAGFASGT